MRRRRIMTWLLAMVMALALFGVGAAAVFGATSGDCGDTAGTVSFEISADGTMTITGTGTIKQQTRANNYSWYVDRTKVKKLVIGEGVTNAPNNAFNGMTNLKEVELPSTLAAWGSNVFQSSSNIETIRVAEGGAFSSHGNILYGDNETRLILSGKAVSGQVELPEGLTTIEPNGLDGRSEITSLKLPEGLKTIGNYAFRGLNKVETIDIPDSVTSIGTNALQNCTSLTEAEVPAGVKSLSNYTFAGDKALTKAVLPEGMTSIGTYAFQNCEKLETLTIPGSVTSIGNNAFAGMKSMQKLDLPEGLTTLGANVFSDCSSLKSMTIPAGIKTLGTATSSSLFINCTALEEVSLPEGLTTIGASAFKGCTSLKEIQIPQTVTTIGVLAFQQCSSLEEVTVPDGVKELTGTFAGCTSLKKIVLPEGLTTLKTGGTGATMVGPFTGCESLKEITIPAGVTTIPKDTFNGCSSLEDLSLSEGVTSIGQNAYMNCTSLEDITIPKTVTTVMGGAFENCTSLTRVRLEDGMEQFNTANKSATTAFKGCSRLTDIYIPDSLEGFQPITFEQADSIQRIHVSEEAKLAVKDNVLYDKDFTKLIYIPASYSGKLVLPDTVTETGSRVAGYTHALTEIVFPEGFKAVGESAFYYADGLRKVTLPETLETIGASGFRATGLESVVIPDRVTSVGTYAFTLCEKMKRAKLGSGLKEIPNAMFFNCHKLEELTLPEEITSIGSTAFSGTRIPEFNIPDGCKSVGATAFANNTNLNQVTLPASLTTIPSTAFNGDSALKYIYYKGTADQWTGLKCNPAFGTVITDYQGVDPQLDAAVISQQPESAIYEKGQEPQEIQLTVAPQGTEGEQYFYTWYKNSSGKAEGGTTVAAEGIENGSTCMPSTDKIGSEYYYCVVVRMVNGYTAERVVSDVAKVTVKMQMEGSGSEQDPFLVSTAADLQTLYSMVKEGNSLEGVFIRMTDDIELPADWDPIGVLKDGATGSNTGKNVLPFSGTFDGDGHTITVPENGKPLFGYVRNAAIRNLQIYGTKIDGTGLVDHYERDYETGSSQSEFGSDAKYIVTIENVTLKKGTKTRESGLIGENNKSQDASSMNPVLIVSCKAEDGVEIGYNHDEDQIGTFAGRVCGMIINCESSADVYGHDRVGGIAGCQDVAMGILHVVNSSYHGKVTATGDFAGGILGSGYRGSAPNALCVEIRNCFADGQVSGKDYVGGIFGAEDEVAQCWSNGIGYISNNLFAGSLKAAEGAKYVGGVIGYYRSLNKYTNFDNNWFADGCGADRWLGGAQFIDTSAEHETESDITYINTEKSVAGCPYVQFCDWKQGLNRTDDPFGAGAAGCGAAASAEGLKNGDVLEKLNSGESSMKNWIADEKGVPCISTDPICYQLELSGDYQTEYFVGDKLNTEGMKLTAHWTNGKTTEPSIDDEDVRIEGFDSESRGVKRLTINYGSAKAECTVRVLLRSDGDKISVSFALYGDKTHDPAEEDIHTMKMGTLQTWQEAAEYEVDLNATVQDVLEIATAGKYTLRGSDHYLAGITPKDGTELAEFTNGADSGWMYTLNGVHSQNTIDEQFLEDGDEIVFHYTDNYHFEEDSLDVTALKKLISEIEALPAAEDAAVADAEAVWAAQDGGSGLEDDLDQLIPSAMTTKLDELDGKLTPEAVQEYQTQADSDRQAAEEALAAARESDRIAQEARDAEGTDAQALAHTAQEDANTAAEKALAADESAKKSVEAWERMQRLAERSGDETAIENAKTGLQNAETAAEAAAEAKAASEALAIAAGERADQIDQEVREAEEQAAATAAKIKAAKKMTVKKLRVKTKKGKAIVTWKKTKYAPAYQVQYKMNGKKWKTLKKSVRGTRVTARKMKKGKRYSFRVRTVSRIQGKSYYGKWTKVKTVKAK